MRYFRGMTGEDPRGVLIGDSAAFVRLARDGEPRELGMTPATIEVKGGPFAGVVRDDTLVGVAAFCDQLAGLHERLSGTATLASYEKFKMVVAGDGLGAMSVSVEIVGTHAPLSSKLCFEMEIDQTYLPAIVRGLRAEFPDG